MAIGQENHRVIAEPMPAHTPGGLTEAGDFGSGQILSGADVSVFVTLGKGERGHPDLLAEELSCFRWLAPAYPGSAVGATTSRSIADIPENTSKQESRIHRRE